MGNVTQYLGVPALAAFSLLTVVLVQLRRDKTGRVRLWIVALVLTALEEAAHAVYIVHTSAAIHVLVHVVALDAYLVAGVTFLESASSHFVHRKRPGAYTTICTAPFLVMMSCYGADMQSYALYIVISVLGLAISLAAVIGMKRPRVHLLVHLGIWLPVIALVALGDVRQAVYTSLAMAFGLTGAAFFHGLPSALKGRLVVVTGFILWALCFLFHPWIAQRHHDWIPLLDQVWDLEKFVVMFGLLVISLEEHSVQSEYEAQHDALTGLANRRLFEEQLQEAVARARTEGTRVVIFTMDMNGFKRVNDTFGHGAGDEMLRAVASRMRSITRQCDTLARVGGDEFQLIATSFGNSTDLQTLRINGTTVAEKFRAAAEQPLLLRTGQILAPSISIGFAVFPDEVKTAKELCYKADNAMYMDKRRTKNPQNQRMTPELAIELQNEWLN